MSQDLPFPGQVISSDKLLDLLQELEFMPLIFRRYIERINGNRFNPSSEEQIEYQKKFLAREQITDRCTG